MKDYSICTPKKVDDVIDVLDSLLSKLTTHSFDNAHLEPLFANLESTIHLVNLWVTNPKKLDESKRPRRFELQCHKLWNICVRSRRSFAVQKPEITRKKGEKALMSVWLLSFLCLELSQIWSDEPRDQTKRAAYLMNLMVPVAKASINDLDFETARLALQRGASHLDNLSLAATRVEKQLPHNSTSFNLQVNLQAKYYAMRIWLSWQEDCLDVAEYMFSKAGAFRGALDVDSAEILAEMIQRVGSALLSRNNVDHGLAWLHRADSILCLKTGELSARGRHLYLAVCNDLISHFLPGSPRENLEEVEKIIQQAQSVLGDDPILHHWWLRAHDFMQGGVCDDDEDRYSEALKRLILITESHDSFLPLILNHLRSFRRKSPTRAADLLTQLLLEPDLVGRNAQCIGRILFLRIFIVSDKERHDEECEHLSDIINRVHDQISTPIASFAVELCHSFIWEKIKSASFSENIDLVEFWCELALRPLFRSSGKQGIGKFIRSFLLCGIRRNELHIRDYEPDSIPSFCGDDVSLTHYLSFKASLLS